MSLGAWLVAGCATTATAPAATTASPSSPAEASNAEAAPPSPPAEPEASPPPSALSSGCAARVGADGLRRSALKRTVDAGLGRWLQTVSVDPLLARGHFRGWIIRSFNSDDGCFAGVDLRAGDVVTRVNGRGVEHPEEALEVWTKLPTSSELVIDFLRDGQARKVRFGIVDP